MPGILERWRMLFRPTVVQFSTGPDVPTQVLNMTARELYNSQDNLAAVVNFLSNSIAQLPLKVYQRNSDDERKRDRDSVAAKLLWSPNQDQTEYEFIRSLATEYYVFGCVYVWVLPDPESESGYQVRIIPTEWVTTTEKTNSYGPDEIVVTSYNGGQIKIPRTEFVRFCTYSPGNPGGYVSPVSALRQTLEEQIQAGRFRRELWKSSGRLNAQIIRPKDVQPWSDETKKRWIEAFRESWGAGGSRAGSIPLMEDGMEIKPFSTSFKESQWMESVKFSREAVAAAYRINPSLVWHTDTQTYASSKDNARALYAECLGPDLQMIQQRINNFLLPMIGADPNTYVEFDFTEKLKGDFEQRASVIQSSVGGPWLTRNEARRDNNLPPIPGGDKLITPLNVVTGGQASPQDTHTNQNAAEVIQPASCSCVKHRQLKAAEDEPEEKEPEESEPEEETEVDTTVPQEEQDAVGNVLKSFFTRQAKSVGPRIGAGGDDWWNADRWDKELADDLEPVMKAIAENHGNILAAALGTEFSIKAIINYIRATAEGRAQVINEETQKKLKDIIEEWDEEADGDLLEAVQSEFDSRGGNNAVLLGSMLAKIIAGWGNEEAVRQARRQGSTKQVYKVWVTGPHARDTHAAMNGQRVRIDEPFPNGADWPGDDNLSAAESCGCNCTTKIIITER